MKALLSFFVPLYFFKISRQSLIFLRLVFTTQTGQESKAWPSDPPASTLQVLEPQGVPGLCACWESLLPRLHLGPRSAEMGRDRKLVRFSKSKFRMTGGMKISGEP